MRFSEWQTFSRDVHARAERVSRMIVDRARETARQAGLDPTMPFLHAHNALVGAYYGKPWPEVDYSKARLVKRLEEASWEPCRIADRVIDRAFRTVVY